MLSRSWMRTLVVCAGVAVILSLAWAACLWLASPRFKAWLVPPFFVSAAVLPTLGLVPCLSAGVSCALLFRGGGGEGGDAAATPGTRADAVRFIVQTMLFTGLCAALLCGQAAVGCLCTLSALLLAAFMLRRYLLVYSAAAWTLTPCLLWQAYMTAALYMVAMLN